MSAAAEPDDLYRYSSSTFRVYRMIIDRVPDFMFKRDELDLPTIHVTYNPYTPARVSISSDADASRMSTRARPFYWCHLVYQFSRQLAMVAMLQARNKDALARPRSASCDRVIIYLSVAAAFHVLHRFPDKLSLFNLYDSPGKFKEFQQKSICSDTLTTGAFNTVSFLADPVACKEVADEEDLGSKCDRIKEVLVEIERDDMNFLETFPLGCFETVSDLFEEWMRVCEVEDCLVISRIAEIVCPRLNSAQILAKAFESESVRMTSLENQLALLLVGEPLMDSVQAVYDATGARCFSDLHLVDNQWWDAVTTAAPRQESSPPHQVIESKVALRPVTVAKIRALLYDRKSKGYVNVVFGDPDRDYPLVTRYNVTAKIIPKWNETHIAKLLKNIPPNSVYGYPQPYFLERFDMLCDEVLEVFEQQMKTGLFRRVYVNVDPSTLSADITYKPKSNEEDRGDAQDSA
jgi:hypothetical protein